MNELRDFIKVSLYGAAANLREQSSLVELMNYFYLDMKDDPQVNGKDTNRNRQKRIWKQLFHVSYDNHEQDIENLTTRCVTELYALTVEDYDNFLWFVESYAGMKAHPAGWIWDDWIRMGQRRDIREEYMKPNRFLVWLTHRVRYMKWLRDYSILPWVGRVKK